jgi:hypothetical protein
MAKVTGPLMSMDASGKFAGALVFSKWKGRPTVRQLITPSNPRSVDQVAVRNAMRAIAAGQRFANLTALKRSGETLTDKAELITLAPAGQAWNGFLVKSSIGAGSLNYTAATAAYSALSGGQKSAWEAAAAALTPAIPDVAQFDSNNAPVTPLSDGEVFFHYCYGLYVAGAMASAPTGTPPTYA